MSANILIREEAVHMFARDLEPVS